MSYEFFHDLTFKVLYACLVVLTFVAIERGLYMAFLSLRAHRVGRAIKAAGANPVDLAGDGKTTDIIGESITEYVLLQRQTAVSRNRIEDLSSALFLQVDGRVNARLWVLDMIITAAPLLGLLGTILGIMETFTALSQGGISDPGAVSRGIGTALIATAIGIGTALYGLVAHSMLHRRAKSLLELFKCYLLLTTV